MGLRDTMSSPSRETHSQSPGFLTPRTKVADLLAQIDAESTPSPARYAFPKSKAGVETTYAADSQSLHSSEDGTHDERPKSSVNMRDRARSTSPSNSELDGPTISSSTLFVSPVKASNHSISHDFSSESDASPHRQSPYKNTRRKASGAGDPDLVAIDNSRSIAHHAEALDDSERLWSSTSKPTRQASRKALLEMERETQRIAREQTLAHQIKVKTKFTTSSLLARFNYHQTNSDPVPSKQKDSPALPIDSDNSQTLSITSVSTPPTSPHSGLGQHDDTSRGQQKSFACASPKPGLSHEPVNNTMCSSSSTGVPIASFDKRIHSSDDELDILPSNDRLRILRGAVSRGKRPGTSSSALHVLKHLSQQGLDSSFRDNLRKGHSTLHTDPGILQMRLRLRAKEQARLQELERIAAMKMKGLDMLTADQREQEEEHMEDMFEKARQAAADLRKAEKAARAALRGTIEADEQNIIPSEDESDDDDEFDDEDSNSCGSDTADSDPEEYEIAGPVDEDGLLNHEGPTPQCEEGASQSADELLHRDQSEVPHVVHDDIPPREHATPRRAARRKRVIVDDDDDDDDDDLEPVSTQRLMFEASVSKTSHTPSYTREDTELETPNVTSNALAAFGFDTAHSTSMMSPTQAFHATMQTPTQISQSKGPLASSAASLALNLSHQVPDAVLGTQTAPSTARSTLMSQRNEDVFGSVNASSDRRLRLSGAPSASDIPASSSVGLHSPGWEPTQDSGLSTAWLASPRQAEAVTSNSTTFFGTQPTVILRVSESPIPVKSKHQLATSSRAFNDKLQETLLPKKHVGKPENVFDKLQRRKREHQSEAEVAEAHRRAREMMDEQAEESEDEYAGLGGDDYVAPETEEDRNMIDSDHVDVNESAIAAHYAERQRIADEASASKLYKDLTTGALRRRAANNFDLEEDEDTLAIRKRQNKQREEARRRALLLRDQNIASLADGQVNKGKEAFIKALADNDDGDENLPEFLDTEYSIASQPPLMDNMTQTNTVHNKRTASPTRFEQERKKSRRAHGTDMRAPQSLFEVQQSVSELLGEPGESPDPDLRKNQSPDAHGAFNEQDDALASERNMRRFSGTDHPPIVDRLNLKRSETLPESRDRTSAWSAPTSGTFKVPALLRRATTRTALAPGHIHTSERIGPQPSNIKFGGGQRSSLAYQARTKERKMLLEEAIKQRAESTARAARTKRSSIQLARGVSGQFE